MITSFFDTWALMDVFDNQRMQGQVNVKLGFQIIFCKARENVTYRSVVLSIPPIFKRQVIDDALKTNPGRQAIETALRLFAWWAGISQVVK